jgi:alpha-beta hydrolase superfamily lysophospholipase
MTRTLATPDGATLLVREWSPDRPPWLRLLLVHGTAEHSGRYDRTGRLLAEGGIVVTAFDLRGHGGSSGRRGDIERWSDLTDDIGRLLAGVQTDAAGSPVALMGHSMGGLLCLDAVLGGVASPDLLVLSSPGLGDALPWWQHHAAPVIARVAPTMAIRNAWDGSALSRDPAVGAAVAADPLCLRGSTARLGHQAFAAQDRVNAALDRLAVPTFVSHGGEDPLVPAATSEHLGSLPGVTRRLYPSLRHETLNEPEGPRVVADITLWLRARARDLAKAARAS